MESQSKANHITGPIQGTQQFPKTEHHYETAMLSWDAGW